jgi:hypothetical protein
MNERIRELAEQAWDDTKEKFGSFVDDGGEVDFTFLHEWTEKFAELIVRECANVLRAESERLYKLSAEEKDELFASNFEICAEKCVDNEVAIREHFGVEE